MKRYSIENTKPKKSKDGSVPVLVLLSKKEKEMLKEVFNFYIFFPLHANASKYGSAQKLFDKVNMSESTLKSKELKIIKKKQ